MQQYYRIAGLNVKMDTFGRTLVQSIPYRIEEEITPDIVIETDYTALKKAYPGILDDTCEYIMSGRNFFSKLLDFDGVYLHSASVIKDGQAFLFSADSGTGKSTHVSLWRQAFGDDCVRILNDDKNVLRIKNGVWHVHGNPWSGKSGINLNLSFPVKGICFIEQGKENTIKKYEGSDLVFRIVEQSYYSSDTKKRIKLLELIDSLITDVPVWHMKCNMEQEAARLAYEAMSGNKYEK